MCVLKSQTVCVCLCSPTHMYRENTYKVLLYIKISNKVGRFDNFRDLARKLSFLPNELDIFDILQHFICTLFIF